jgi:hypothetical protein
MSEKTRASCLRITFPGHLALSCFLIVLYLIIVTGSASAGGSGGSKGSQGGQNTSSPQPPPIPLKVEPLFGCTTGRPWTPEENLELSRHYNDGDWQWIQKRLGDIIHLLKCQNESQFDISQVTFSVVFLNEALEMPALVRVLVHDPQPEVFGSRVPGFDLYDLQLLPDSRLFVVSHYQATPSPNPLIAQFSSALSQVVGGLSKAIPPPPPPNAFAPRHTLQDLCEDSFSPKVLNSYAVFHVALPHSFRPFDASIPQVSVTDQLSSADLVRYILNSLKARSREKDKEFPNIHCDLDKDKWVCGLAAGPGPMTALNTNFCHLLTDPASKCLPQPVSACPPTTSSTSSTSAPLPSLCPTDQPTCVSSLEDAVTFLADEVETAAGVNQAAAEDFGSQLYASYIGLATQPQPASAAAATQYTFGRLTRFGFSLGAAGILKTSLNKPVKVNTANNTIVDAPLTELLTFVALDYHPWPYDETRFSPSLAERFRFFGGISATPDAGLVAGLGVEILRGLTLEGGYGLLLANVLRTGEMVGGQAAPKNPTPRGKLGVLFIGIGYSLQ